MGGGKKVLSMPPFPFSAATWNLTGEGWPQGVRKHGDGWKGELMSVSRLTILVDFSAQLTSSS